LVLLLGLAGALISVAGRAVERYADRPVA
jgi:hypothetical protein